MLENTNKNTALILLNSAFVKQINIKSNITPGKTVTATAQPQPLPAPALLAGAILFICLISC